MKKKLKDLSEKERIRTLDALYTAAGSLRGRDAMKLFLRDLLTPSERVMLGRRILIAQKLIEGKGREEIMAELHVGPDTIWRIEQWLGDQFPGFENALKGLRRAFDARARKAERQKIAKRLKQKYPLHFLLFPTSEKNKT